MNKRTSLLPVFLFLFFFSGFSGLIYESIWTHYLKLFLGHSSYAQVLVLAIFMGGMAIGAAFAAKLSKKLTNLILFYAIAEGVIGLLGISFHNIFVSVEATAFDSIFPLLNDPWLVHLVKWSIASLLIIPQSILLGATFPLLAAGILRRFPGDSGKKLAFLYFVNSFGAAIGILFNAFWLIPAVGLPGAILTAGIINVFIAITVYFLSKHDHYPAAVVVEEKTDKTANSNFNLFFIIAGLTGLASFMYEIAWIRMLSMVLGGSTHSFEIMLSAFILGIAIGGFWIKKKIDNFDNPLHALGLIQLAMGALAILTIPLYNQTYEVMAFAIKALNTNESGYLLYTFLSYFIALVVMLPATICAGTTLPLITFVLLKKKSADSSIGKVYAWNTVGSILGVVLAVQVVMPLLGLKWVIAAGALVDVGIGLYIISRFGKLEKTKFNVAIVSLCLAVLVVLPFAGLDTKKMASGVFRYGLIEKQNDSDVIFHMDGKTSTVAVKEFSSGLRVVSNNGKPDAGLIIKTNDKKRATTTTDTPTMVLLGSLPYVYKPEAKLIANIGLGSGLTAHVLLHHENLMRLDTIEIEPAVLEAARYFRPNINNLFEDKRSNIIIDDAKTYFAAAGNKYDVIVSEPPNPWVSGVSGLFSQEFYHQINRYLDDDGVFVQWMHLYEISPQLVSTVYHALRPNFKDVHIYQISANDIAIVASRSTLKPDYTSLFNHSGLKEELASIDVVSADDLAIRKLAGKEKLDPVFAVLGDTANSDYFPVLDIGADKTRFLKTSAISLYQIYKTRLLGEVLGVDYKYFFDITPAKHGANAVASFKSANDFYQTYLKLLSSSQPYFIAATLDEVNAKNMIDLLHVCRDTQDKKLKKLYLSKLVGSVLIYFDFLQKDELRKLFYDFKKCENMFDEKGKRFIDVHLAWLKKDFTEISNLTGRYLEGEKVLSDKYDSQMLKLNLLSRIKKGELDGSDELLKKTTTPLLKVDLELLTLLRLAGADKVDMPE